MTVNTFPYISVLQGIPDCSDMEFLIKDDLRRNYIMQVGLIGLGKMGLNLGKNLMDHKHEVAAFDLNASAVEEMKEYGATGTSSLSELVQSLQSPRIL